MIISIFTIVITALVANYIIGCMVLAAIDDQEQRLFNWAKSAPIPCLFVAVVQIWPVIAWKWMRQ